MSDNYTIGGVTVSPQGGGWYELSHPKLENAERVQGKEKADAEAAELDKRLSQETGMMESQGDLDPNAALAAAERLQRERDQEELASLRASLQESQELLVARDRKIEQLETKTVVTGPGDVPTVPVTTYAPAKYEGVLDDNRKAELKKLGIETTDIVLEENADIPPTGLFVGHNGRGYMIVPGERVTVPNFLLGVLDDAIMSAPVVDSKTTKVVGYRNRSRYPYRKM